MSQLQLPSPTLAAAPGDKYAPLSTPLSVRLSTHGLDDDVTREQQRRALRPHWVLYTSILVALIQPLQYGWSTSQLNLTTFNDADDCNARPVPEGRCLMFPGHSKLEWTFAVNAWIVGGMVGSLASGRFSDALGRKKVMLANCGFIIVGAAIQATVSNIWLFVLGRVFAGIASGCATGVVGGYINEVTPPHLRSSLGVGFQISITIGILLVGLTFFFANTSSGWRYIAAFPIVLAGVFMALAPFVMVESPAWLLMKGRHEDAEKELARLFGHENVHVALGWLEAKENQSNDVEQAQPDELDLKTSGDNSGKSNLALLFSPLLLRQLITAVGIACAQQLSGINAVFFYSSDIFKKAGIADDRIGTLIIDVVNVLPTFFSGWLATRYGNRKMILCGMIGMLVSAVCMTISLLSGIQALSIVFTATYVAAFGVSLGPLVWVVVADLFPDSVRASASSICIGSNWTSNLVIGICYPYVADALNDYGFVPFVGTLTVFYVFVLRMVPETSGKSSEEIQELFAAHRKQKNLA
uniref:Hexose transporter 1 n=1 Tax=Globisporangium ultimum (strain ATCC 200006 / CBS 805.95 / DAOM BR144) TaxID=431595 RepID=K3W636_GLOUD